MILFVCQKNAFDRASKRGPPTARDSLAFCLKFKMRKSLSVFCDESGDSGFSNNKSRDFYIVSLLFHDQSENISQQLNRFSKFPTFHAGPLVRREDQYKNLEIKERQKLLNSILILTSILPIRCKTFVFDKVNFNKDEKKLQLKLTSAIKEFLFSKQDFFCEFDEIIIYYDGGQQIVSKSLNDAFSETGYSYIFKKEVASEKYRLFQVCDFICFISLVNAKYGRNRKLSNSELKIMDERHFKNLYLRTVRKKEM